MFVNILSYGQHPSASTQLMGAVGELCTEIKRKNVERRIIISGPHPSALPERTLSEENCDFVIEGEGFYTLKNLLEGADSENIPGLWWKDKEEIKHNPRARLIKDLSSELSEISWDLLPMKKYRAHNWHCLGNLESRGSYAALSTSLGCPFHCSFCCINAPFGKPSYRKWNPETVLSQIDYLVKKHGVKNFKFIDELFVLEPSHFLGICEGLIERDYGLNIWAYARIDTTKKDYLKKLKKSGVNWLGLGIESGSDRVRGDVSKGKFNLKDIRETARMIQEDGISIGANYIFGLPEDDLESMKQTLNLAEELNCEWANFYCNTAYPGSQLYQEALENKWKLPDSWSDFAQHSYEFIPLPTRYLSPEEVLSFRDSAFESYFQNPKYLNMVESRFGMDARKHIEGMNRLKLKRKILEK